MVGVLKAWLINFGKFRDLGLYFQIKTNDIYEFYRENDEDIRLKRAKVNNMEFLTTMKYIEQVCVPESKILDACAGTGVYAFHLANNGFKVVAGDLVGRKM